MAGDLVLGVCGSLLLDKHLVAIRPASVSKDGQAREIWRMEETMPHIPTPLLSKTGFICGRTMELLPASDPKREKKYGKHGLKG